MGHSRPVFSFICDLFQTTFLQKKSSAGFELNRQIEAVHADHYTTTTALTLNICLLWAVLLRWKLQRGRNDTFFKLFFWLKYTFNKSYQQCKFLAYHRAGKLLSKIIYCPLKNIKFTQCYKLLTMVVLNVVNLSSFLSAQGWQTLFHHAYTV